MSNNYYTASGNPATGSEGLSSLMRAEFVSLQTSFDLLPALTSNGGKAVVVNVGGTALTVTTGTLALAGNLTTTGAFNTTFAQGASVTLTLPAVNGTLATLAGTETLTNKTLVAPALGTPASGTLTNATGLPIATGVSGLGSGVATALAVAVGSAGAPVVNGGALGAPSSGVATNLTGTATGLTAGTATNQFGGSVSATTLAASGAVSGAGFAALFASPPAIGGTAAGTGAFTTLSATSTVSGAGFTAWAASPPSIGSTAPGTGAFTTLSASSTVSGTGFSTYLASPPAIGGSAAAAGSFTTLSASGTVSGAGVTARFASPGPIGSTAASTGAFTTLSASSTVSGAGFSTYLASPPAIGGSAPAAGSFTTLSTTDVATGLTAAAGTNTTQFATTAFVQAGVSAVNSLKNNLHNGLFTVQQRGVGAFTANNAYTADRWVISFTNGTTSVTMPALADADRAALGDEEAAFALQNVFTGTSGAADVNAIVQSIEGVRRLANKTVTVSFWAKASTGTPKFGASLDQQFGTGGSPSAGVLGTGQSVTLSTTWTRYTLTFALASIAGKTLGTNGDDRTNFLFWYSSGTTNATRSGTVGVQSGTFQIWGAQLEIGSAATAIEKRDPQQELALCQRFYRTGQMQIAGYNLAGNASAQQYEMPTMRASPTVVANFTTNSNCSVSALVGTTNTLQVSTTVTATGVFNAAGTYTASADF